MKIIRWERKFLQRMFLLGIMLIYITGLQLGYVYLVANQYGLGYSLYIPTLGEIVLASLLAWLPAWVIPIELNKPSVAVGWLLYLTAYVSSMVIPAYTGVSSGFWWWRLFTFLGCIIIVWPKNIKALYIKSISPGIYKIMISGILSLSVFIVLKTYGLQYHIPSFSEIYQIRKIYASSINSRWIGYAVEYLGNVFGVFIFAMALIRKKPVYFIWGIVLIILEYTTTAFKSVLFIPLLLLGIWFLSYHQRKRYFGIYISTGYVTIIGLSFITAQIFDLLHPLNVANLFLRRTLIIPGLIAGFYFAEFNGGPLVLFSNGVLQNVVRYPFQEPYQYIVANRYFGAPGGDTVGNIWADAYVQLGFIGIILMSLVLRGLLELIDRKWTSSGKEVVFASLVLSIQAFTLSNTSLQTTLLSHGLLLSSILLLLMPNRLKNSLFETNEA